MAMTEHHHAPDTQPFDAASPEATERTVVIPDVELDMLSSPRLADRLTVAEARASSVDVDMQRVTFMDSTALHVLIRAHRRGASGGRTIRVVGCNDRIRRLFEITGTTFLLDDPDRDAGFDAASTDGARAGSESGGDRRASYELRRRP
ncbi:MAG TPA: STAS domain-containing protein [Actinomycetota bacterium]|nr:STAS domain-containing protein [Actinomycetota bacterium]